MNQKSHEDFGRRVAVAPGSDRSFGLQMAIILALVSGFSLWREGSWWPWTGALALGFMAAAVLRPSLLRLLNHGWFRFGEMLHRIVSPIVMGILFFATVLPIGIALRLAGKDLLNLRREPGKDSYWLVRDPPGPAAETMRDQF